MKTSLKLSVSAALLALSCVASAKDWTTIRIGVDPTYAPFESVAPDGRVVGFDVDLGNALWRQAQGEMRLGTK